MKRTGTSFREFYEDEEVFTPEVRAEIEFETELILSMVRAREEAGLTQAQLAENTGMKQSAIARLENMKSMPRVDTLIKLLRPMGYRLAIVPIDSEDERV